MSPVFGLASDQTLEFEVVTTEGELVVASPTENSDLYWALSGGVRFLLALFMYLLGSPSFREVAPMALYIL